MTKLITTEEEILAATINKADLVGGKVPAEQLPAGGSGDMTKAHG